MADCDTPNTDGSIDMQARAAIEEHIQQAEDRLVRVEADLAVRIDILEARFVEAGYFGTHPDKTHPLVQRIDDLESRLSVEVLTTSLSKALRRSIAWTVVLASVIVLGLLGNNVLRVIEHREVTDQLQQELVQNRAYSQSLEHQIQELLHDANSQKVQVSP